MRLLFLLLAGHALADYTLQTPYIAVNKNPWNKRAPLGYDAALHGPLQTIWPYVLGSHALEHGLMVYLATGGCLTLGMAETAAHFLIDLGKCGRRYGIHMDQALHLLCKVLWAYLLVGGYAA